MDPAVARRFNAPVDASMVEALALTTGSRVLDVGCGRGDHLHQFASRVGAAGQVIAIDLSAEALATARAELAGAVGAERVRFEQGDVNRLPLPAASVDLAWASHLLHFQPDPVASLRELARVTRRGGRVVVRENFSMRVMLPRDTGIGEPGLESRLTTHFDAWFNLDGQARGRMPFGWAEALARAGLSRVSPRSFLHEVAPPFTPEQRAYLRALLARRWEARLPAPDRQAIEQLLGEADAFGRRDAYYCAVSTLYVGHVVDAR